MDREREAEIVAYAEKLSGMADDALRNEVENMVWLSGFAANNPRSIYHPKCDATYAECQRRKTPWIYQQGWNSAFRSAGHEPNESDIRSATEEYWREKEAAS